MSDEHEDKPNIIVIKRIIKKGGHHGGSWKIAYADFVTAMMAFFMLMWMLSMLDKYQLQGISDYFKKPMKDIFVDNQLHNTNIPKVASEHTENSELAPKKGLKDGRSLKKNTSIKNKIADANDEKDAGIINEEGQMHAPTQTGHAENNEQGKKKNSGPNGNKGSHGDTSDKVEKKELHDLKKQLMASMQADPEVSQYEKNLDFELMDDGLKIRIKSLENKPMFSVGKTDFEVYGGSVIKWLSKELNKSPKKITIIGHTDTQPYGDPARYTNWELSADRANSIRRYLIKNGMDPDKIIRVQGSGSMNLLIKKDGANPANRRIELIVLTDKAAENIMNH